MCQALLLTWQFRGECDGRGIWLRESDAVKENHTHHYSAVTVGHAQKWGPGSVSEQGGQADLASRLGLQDTPGGRREGRSSSGHSVPLARPLSGARPLLQGAASLSCLWELMSRPAQTLWWGCRCPRSLHCSLSHGPRWWAPAHAGMESSRGPLLGALLLWEVRLLLELPGPGGMKRRKASPRALEMPFLQERGLEAMGLEEYLAIRCSRSPDTWPLIGSS